MSAGLRYLITACNPACAQNTPGLWTSFSSTMGPPLRAASLPRRYRSTCMRRPPRLPTSCAAHVLRAALANRGGMEEGSACSSIDICLAPHSAGAAKPSQVWVEPADAAAHHALVRGTGCGEHWGARAARGMRSCRHCRRHAPRSPLPAMRAAHLPSHKTPLLLCNLPGGSST